MGGPGVNSKNMGTIDESEELGESNQTRPQTPLERFTKKLFSSRKKTQTVSGTSNLTQSQGLNNFKGPSNFPMTPLNNKKGWNTSPSNIIHEEESEDIENESPTTSKKIMVHHTTTGGGQIERSIIKSKSSKKNNLFIPTSQANNPQMWRQMSTKKQRKIGLRNGLTFDSVAIAPLMREQKKMMEEQDHDGIDSPNFENSEGLNSPVANNDDDNDTNALAMNKTKTLAPPNTAVSKTKTLLAPPNSNSAVSKTATLNVPDNPNMAMGKSLTVSNVDAATSARVSRMLSNYKGFDKMAKQQSENKVQKMMSQSQSKQNASMISMISEMPERDDGAEDQQHQYQSLDLNRDLSNTSIDKTKFNVQDQTQVSDRLNDLPVPGSLTQINTTITRGDRLLSNDQSLQQENSNDFTQQNSKVTILASMIGNSNMNVSINENNYQSINASIAPLTASGPSSQSNVINASIAPNYDSRTQTGVNTGVNTGANTGVNTAASVSSQSRAQSKNSEYLQQQLNQLQQGLSQVTTGPQTVNTSNSFGVLTKTSKQSNTSSDNSKNQTGSQQKKQMGIGVNLGQSPQINSVLGLRLEEGPRSNQNSEGGESEKLGNLNQIQNSSRKQSQNQSSSFKQSQSQGANQGQGSLPMNQLSIWTSSTQQQQQQQQQAQHSNQTSSNTNQIYNVSINQSFNPNKSGRFSQTPVSGQATPKAKPAFSRNNIRHNTFAAPGTSGGGQNQMGLGGQAMGGNKKPGQPTQDWLKLDDEGKKAIRKRMLNVGKARNTLTKMTAPGQQDNNNANINASQSMRGNSAGERTGGQGPGTGNASGINSSMIRPSASFRSPGGGPGTGPGGQQVSTPKSGNINNMSFRLPASK